MDPIIGQIILWPVPWVPEGWALCNGAVLPINQNQALYSLLGNTYGGVAGQSFALPDLRSRIPLGTQVQTQVGQQAGSATATTNAIGAGAVNIGVNNLPAHTHSATFTPGGGGSTTASVAIPVSDAPATGTTTDTPGTTTVLTKGTAQSGLNALPVKEYTTSAANTTLKPFDMTLPAGGGGTVAVAPSGNGQALPIQVSVPVTVSTLQPSLTLNYIIALTGIYPSRP